MPGRDRPVDCLCHALAADPSGFDSKAVTLGMIGKRPAGNKTSAPVHPPPSTPPNAAHSPRDRNHPWRHRRGAGEQGGGRSRRGVRGRGKWPGECRRNGLFSDLTITTDDTDDGGPP
ncbi:hypothetical protein GCM10018790_17010 [Kitasatospora xanthocidica]|nr:hypothetical protein GCM10018790_17010 [Kitasatospora xanthocidica]